MQYLTKKDKYCILLIYNLYIHTFSILFYEANNGRVVILTIYFAFLSTLEIRVPQYMNRR